MLIDSKFRDYYDSVMSWGIDKTCIYNRLEETILLKDKELNRLFPWILNKQDLIQTKPFVIGFCGSFFPGILEQETLFGPTIMKINYQRENFNFRDKYRFSFSKIDIFSKTGLDKFFDIKTWANYEKFFHEFKCPVFVLTRDKSNNLILIKNPQLKTYHFQKISPPADAFQKIYQYLAGVLGNTEKETINISDKVKLQQKGFDKNSFKTMKGDKKPRKSNRNK